MYLSSARFDRKSRERSAAPTSLIIVRSRHPFLEKTDVVPVLMEVWEMESAVRSMDLRCVAAWWLICDFTSCSRYPDGFEGQRFSLHCRAAREVYGGLVLVWDVILGEGRQRRVFLQPVAISKYLLYLYPNFIHGRLLGSCKCVFGVEVSLFGQIVF